MSRDPNPSGSPDYYAARAIEERRLAMAAKDSNVRSIHLEMAEKYDELAARGAQPSQSMEDQQRA